MLGAQNKIGNRNAKKEGRSLTLSLFKCTFCSYQHIALKFGFIIIYLCHVYTYHIYSKRYQVKTPIKNGKF